MLDSVRRLENQKGPIGVGPFETFRLHLNDTRGVSQIQTGRGYFGSFSDLTCFPAARFEACEVTAIAAVMAPWGVLMAADGRMTLDDATKATASEDLLLKETEHAQKILPIIEPARTVMWGLIGSIGNEDFSLDLRDEIKRHALALSAQEFGTPREYVIALGKLVARAITGARWFPDTGTKSERGCQIARAVFGGCFGSLVRMGIVEFCHSDEVARAPLLEYLEGPMTSQRCFGPRAITDQMYDHLGNPLPDGPLAQYASALNANPLVSEARRFAVGYIEACCSPEGRRLDPEGCKKIGGHIHAATVKPRSGFQWIILPTSEEQ